jgi:hypothetical protein
MNGLHGIIFSFERRDDLGALTSVRAPASIPFGGRYRAVDFALSNLVNAGAADVGVILSGQYESLLDHLGTGKNWDLSRKRGGLKILPLLAYGEKIQRTDFRGRMEALTAVRPYLNEIRQDYVCLMDGDLVANLPLGEILDTHIRSGADITAVCGGDGAYVEDGTYFRLAPDGRVQDVLYHLEKPMEFRSLEVYVLSRKLLLKLVDEFAARDDMYSWRHAMQVRKDSAGSAGVRLERLCGADSLCAGILRAQYAAHGPGGAGGSLLPGAAHPRQGRRQVLRLHRPGGTLHRISGGGRLQHRGHGGKLHPVSRRGGGGRRGDPKLRPV